MNQMKKKLKQLKKSISKFLSNLAQGSHYAFRH